MQTELIEQANLSHGAKYGVLVDGVRVLRLRNGWQLDPSDAKRIWNEVLAACPPAEGERVRMGSRPAINYYGPITERQSIQFAQRTHPLIAAARRATKGLRAQDTAQQRDRRRQSEIARCDFHLKVGA